jgi:hypothetical protein
LGALADAEPLANNGENTSLNLFDGPRLIKQDDAMWLACGNGAVLLVDAAVEVVPLALEAVLVGAVLANVTVVAAASASERGVERWQQQQREIRLHVVAGCAVHLEHALDTEAAAGALVRLRRIGVPVAEDNLATFQGGQNDLMERLRAIGKHQSHLGGWGNFAELGFAL